MGIEGPSATRRISFKSVEERYEPTTRVLLSCFSEHKNLLILDLSYNKIKVYDDICELIIHNNTLTELNLKGNFCASPLEFDKLSEALGENTSIIKF